jgi:hypothetical protein
METGGKAESTARRPFDQGSAGLFIVLKLAKKEQESAPYSILAQIYDFVMIMSIMRLGLHISRVC